MDHLICSGSQPIKIKNIVKADNCHLYDAQGKEYLDLESGVWCTAVGHSNTEVNQAMIEQIGQISHTGFCYLHPATISVARKICHIANMPDGKCEFLSSGSESVEYGMRIARIITQKPLALTFLDSYFGAYGDAAVRNSDSWHIYDRLGCSCSTAEGCTGDCDNFKQIPFDRIGIFLFEPGSSSGHVRFASQILIEKIKFQITQHHGLVMANEITTGIGRTGKWFGFQHYDLKPDIIAIGKGIGNGYPVSVTVISDEIALQLKNTPFVYAQSHQNDPLGAVVADAVTNYITKHNLIEKAKLLGEYTLEQIKLLKAEYPVIKEIRGRGLMIAIEFHTKAQQIFDELLERGIIVSKRPNAETLRIDPALTIRKKDIDFFIKTLKEILGAF